MKSNDEIRARDAQTMRDAIDKLDAQTVRDAIGELEALRARAAEAEAAHTEFARLLVMAEAARDEARAERAAALKSCAAMREVLAELPALLRAALATHASQDFVPRSELERVARAQREATAAACALAASANVMRALLNGHVAAAGRATPLVTEVRP